MGRSRHAGNVTVTDLRVGDCFNAAEFTDEDAEIGDVDGVPCDRATHLRGLCGRRLRRIGYPGHRPPSRTAFGEVCVPPFESYVGVPYADSVLWASAITPTEDGWDSGDHEFICHLHEEDTSMITGSQRGANR